MDVEKIFDAVGKASAFICIQDQRDSKAQQLRDVQAKRCGNCWHWMKTSCIPEKKYKKFKSCNSFACKDFELSDLGGLIPKFKTELAELDKRLAEFAI